MRIAICLVLTMVLLGSGAFAAKPNPFDENAMVTPTKKGDPKHSGKESGHLPPPPVGKVPGPVRKAPAKSQNAGGSDIKTTIQNIGKAAGQVAGAVVGTVVAPPAGTIAGSAMGGAAGYTLGGVVGGAAQNAASAADQALAAHQKHLGAPQRATGR